MAGRLGRKANQFGTVIGLAPRKVKSAGRESGVRRVKDHWSLWNVTERGKPHQYV